MFKGLTQLTERDRLAARVVELEEENKRLREEASSRILNHTTFHQVKSPLHLDVKLRDYIVDHAARRFEGVMDEHILMVAREATKAAKAMGGGRRSFYADSAMADMCDMQVEVTLPEVRTCFRVAGAFR